jgi:hypothetical protein
MARVLVLLPGADFDPTEAAVSWHVLVNADMPSVSRCSGRVRTKASQRLDPLG